MPNYNGKGSFGEMRFSLDNQMQMIYPSSNSLNVFIRAIRVIRGNEIV